MTHVRIAKISALYFIAMNVIEGERLYALEKDAVIMGSRALRLPHEAIIHLNLFV